MAEKKFSELFAFDLDGTLVHTLPSGERAIPDFLLETVHRLSKKANVVVATGRRYRAAVQDISRLPKMKYAILNNGLVVKNHKGLTIKREELSPKRALEIARILKKQNIEFFFSADGFREKIDFIFVRDLLENSEILQTVYKRTKGVNHILKSIDDIAVFKKAPLLHLASVGQYQDLLKHQKAVQKLLPKNFRAILIKNIGFSSLGALEIMPKRFSKWTGVEYIQKKLAANRVIAVGDDENDIEMIKSADIGLVMNHAEPHVKKASRHHIDGPNGLNDFLKEFL